MHREDEDVRPADEAAIAAFMQRVAEPPLRAWSLPDAEAALRQARWRRRWEAERRMDAPIDLVLPFQVAAGLAAVALLLTRGLPLLLAVTLHSQP